MRALGQFLQHLGNVPLYRVDLAPFIPQITSTRTGSLKMEADFPRDRCVYFGD
ncbi:MAG UNVERIFIED_CONTAM: hypothetical protein LVR29_08700 [Microcystis novacekii LVE1205-3]